MAALPVLLLAATTTPTASLWNLLLPIIVGCASIYLLLPRPQPYPTWVGAALGVLALVLAALLVVRTGLFSIEAVLFYAFSLIAIVSGALLVTLHNPARAALSFALVILSSCGLFLLLAAPFLMAATVIIYAGAIIVIFLFVLMLAQQTGLDDADLRSREPFFSAIAGFALLTALLYVLEVTYGTSTVDRLLAKVRHASGQESAAEINKVVGPDDEMGKQIEDFLRAHGLEDLRAKYANDVRVVWVVNEPEKMKQLLDATDEILQEARSRLQQAIPVIQPHADHPEKMSSFSGPTPLTPPSELRRDSNTGIPHLPAENASYLGRSLFTDYLLAVELAGFLLLVAVVGAIAIAQRGTKLEKPA